MTLLNGQTLNKKEFADQFNITERSIQRDLSDLKMILTNHYPYHEMIYSRSKGGYYLNTQSRFNKKEILPILKILLESRALNSKELTQLVNGLNSRINEPEKKELNKLIANELLFYSPLSHNKSLIEEIWFISMCITKNQALKNSYTKNDGQLVSWVILPTSIIFSDFYFYIIAYNAEYKKYSNFSLDRIIKLKEVEKNFSIENKLKPEDSVVRKKVHYMYQQNLVYFTFEYWGIVEAALDRIPTAKVIKQKQNSVIIQGEAYYQGLLMWLLSQGSKVKVLSPYSLIEDIKNEISDINKHYFILKKDTDYLIDSLVCLFVIF